MTNNILTSEWVKLDNLISNFLPSAEYQLQNKGTGFIEVASGDPAVETTTKFLMNSMQVAVYKKAGYDTYVRAIGVDATLSIEKRG